MFHGEMTLAEAKIILRPLAKNGGADCPCCTQFVKVYPRRVHSTMARSLIKLYNKAGREFYHTPSLPGDIHEISQLSWWKLIEEERTIHRPDGGRAGYWRVTRKGERWLSMEIKIQEYALIFDSRVLGYEGKYVDIKYCLGKKFNYNELMGKEMHDDTSAQDS
jgi:hypothetical protein